MFPARDCFNVDVSVIRREQDHIRSILSHFTLEIIPQPHESRFGAVFTMTSNKTTSKRSASPSGGSDSRRDLSISFAPGNYVICGKGMLLLISQVLTETCQGGCIISDLTWCPRFPLLGKRCFIFVTLSACSWRATLERQLSSRTLQLYPQSFRP